MNHTHYINNLNNKQKEILYDILNILHSKNTRTKLDDDKIKYVNTLIKNYSEDYNPYFDTGIEIMQYVESNIGEININIINKNNELTIQKLNKELFIQEEYI
jgi:hypothetical protein